MARSVHQILEDVKGRGFDARLQHIKASYRFDIEGAGAYRIEVDHGRLTVREDAGPAECVIACSAEELVRIVDGAQNMLTAFMQGRVRIEGDLALAKLFHGLLPASRHARPQVGAGA